MQAERTFTLADFTTFAELSGDYNPLHTNPVMARRTQLGECVAHGIFVLLWALDTLQAQGSSSQQWTKLSAKFLRPIRAGVKVAVVAKEKSSAEVSLTVSEAERVLCQCEVVWAEAGPGAAVSNTRNEIPPHEEPAQLQVGDATKISGALDLFWPVKQGKVLFPTLAATQKSDSLAAMLATTRVIGMKVPGEHSVFIQCNFSFVPHAEVKQPFTYRVKEYRKSSQRLCIAIAGTAGHGILWALVRHPPVVQPGMAVIKQRVPANRFAGLRVIAVGGSRGLGEIAAKVLAAAGAEVTLTYCVGSDDANRVAVDITANGGRAIALQLNITDPGWEANLSARCVGFDHLCYFASPPIVEGDGSILNAPLFEKFCTVYVTGLVRVAQWLTRNTAGKFALFNASTVLVESPPLRNLE